MPERQALYKKVVDNFQFAVKKVFNVTFAVLLMFTSGAAGVLS